MSRPDSPMPQSLAWIEEECRQLERAHLRRPRREFVPGPGLRCRVDGHELINFAANDYLNLAGDPRVVAAAQRALADCGAGARASALVCGRTQWHVALEQRLAEFEGQAAAVLFPSGFAANMGAICALVGRQDVIFSDRMNHASLIDGCRLSGAQILIYDHHDLAALERDLSQAPAGGRRLLVTDTVFSMDGDLAPLPELCDLAERYGLILLVDEAHATGVFGAGGRGVAELQGVEDRIALRVGTLSKAVGTQGGFIAGPKLLTDWLWNRARPQVFSTALAPATCAAAEQAVAIIQTEPERRQVVLRLAEDLRRRMGVAGIPVSRQAVGPIVPVLLERPERAVRVARHLEQQGYLVGAIRPPTVPAGTSRLRITVSSGHTEADLAGLVRALAGALETDLQ